MNKKNKPQNLLFPSLIIVVLLLMLAFGNWQLQKQEERMDEIEKAVVENSQTANIIVNFINSSLNQMQ